jgi:hypothetical protein
VHWQAAKSVLRYLSGTQNLGLLFDDRTQQFIGYTDSDFAGDVTQRKSTGGFVFMFGGAAVAWSSKLHLSWPQVHVKQNWLRLLAP